MQTKAAEYDRTLIKQFIHGLGEEGMISEILREVSALEDSDDTTSKRVLLWTQKVEAQRTQKEDLDSMKEAKEYDYVRCSTQSMTMRPIESRNSRKLQILWDRASTETVSYI